MHFSRLAAVALTTLILAAPVRAQQPAWYEIGEVLLYAVPSGANLTGAEGTDAFQQWQLTIPDPTPAAPISGMTDTVFERSAYAGNSAGSIDSILGELRLDCPALRIDDRVSAQLGGRPSDTAVFTCPDNGGTVEMVTLIEGQTRQFVLHRIFLPDATQAALDGHVDLLNSVLVCTRQRGGGGTCPNG